MLCCLGLVPAHDSLAHPVEPCLARLSQLSVTLKDCELHQVEEGQCGSSRARLDAQIALCKQQQFTDQAINRGIDYGYASLEGDVGQSPYRRQVRKQQWENSLMKPNLIRFGRLFPDALHVHESLMERFNTQACPKQYAGKSDRYVYFDVVTLTQYPTSYDELAPEKYVYHFFAPEKKGVCYAPDAGPAAVDASAAGPRVVNIPGYFLAELEAADRVKVVRCASGDCAAEKTALADLYDQYSQQYRHHRQLLICSDIEQRNDSRRAIKGVKQSKVKLPDYCPAQEIQVQALNARGLLQQLEQRLFQDVTFRIETANSE
ncbi:MAG: hypothetical protein CMK83_11205 [Pseudomonadales bacterium]|nr:hypothetical protein [Pseudomonadales bacterium]TNC90980.1 MAG: hypothetical protein CSH49_00635 [Alcanivorax sp.]HAG93733.1 hypothetical protein [Gammaproteobacteria bacterium]MAQ24774.1 hypothetical protein [Pseudomonadales bacterium]HAU13446.1 hypothetical protein [Gammaproteobacteria bacterium]|tara:strand:- start:7121 stop:8074 length:954 start_codon:yes stop_codon:yes gene_type:complete